MSDLFNSGIRPAVEYRAWKAMRWRCNPKNKNCRRNYYERNIVVCDRWNSFDNFLADMGLRPSPKYSLDRVDNNKGYSPDNCRWATRLEQNNNTKRTNYYAQDKTRKPLMEIARETGIHPETLRARIKKGWGYSKIIAEPITAKTRKRDQHGQFV